MWLATVEQSHHLLLDVTHSQMDCYACVSVSSSLSIAGRACAMFVPSYCTLPGHHVHMHQHTAVPLSFKHGQEDMLAVKCSPHKLAQCTSIVIEGQITRDVLPFPVPCHWSLFQHM